MPIGEDCNNGGGNDDDGCDSGNPGQDCASSSEAPLVCESGYHEDNGQCKKDKKDEESSAAPLSCEAGYHEENGQCKKDKNDK